VTVLTDEADALAVGEEIASTSRDPQTLVSLTIRLQADQIQLFEIVQADIGRPRQTDVRVFEVLSRTLALRGGELLVDLRLRQLPGRVPVDIDFRVTEDGVQRITESGAVRIVEA
jgi:hypothetical protein